MCTYMYIHLGICTSDMHIFYEGIFHYLVVVYLRPEKSFMSVVKKKKIKKNKTPSNSTNKTLT